MGALAGAIADPGQYNKDIQRGCEAVSVGATATNSLTTTTTYADMADVSSVAFTKIHADTAILVSAMVSAVSSATATRGMIGVSISGTDYDIFKMFFDETTRQMSTGFNKIAAGLAAGNYVIQLRWKRLSGAGQIDRFSADDWLCLSALEVRA